MHACEAQTELCGHSIGNLYTWKQVVVDVHMKLSLICFSVA
jgi:hypothetical protein